MKNLFNKGLLYKEWKNMKWIFAILFVSIMFAFIVPFMKMLDGLLKLDLSKCGSSEIILEYSDIFKNITSGLNMGGCIIGLLIMAIATIIISMEYNNKKCENLCSMPFTKEEIIFNKLFLGILIIVVSMLVVFIIISIAYFSNINILKGYKIINYKQISSKLILITLIYVFIYTFIIFIQSLMGKSYLGGIVGGIFLVLPIGIGTMLTAIFDLWKFNLNLRPCINNFISKLELVLSKITIIIYPEEGILTCGLKVSIVFILIIIFGFLSIYSFKKLPLENVGYIVYNKILEYVFKIGVSICSGMLASTITAGYLINKHNLYKYYWESKQIIRHVKPAQINRLITIDVLVGILVMLIIYMLMSKLARLSKK